MCEQTNSKGVEALKLVHEKGNLEDLLMLSMTTSTKIIKKN